MKSSARLYQCCRCHAQVIVCRRCDRGQRYYANGCSKKARHESLNRANQKYQLTRAGRFNNAARQASFRERQKQKVTDQGSTQSLRHASLKAMLDQAKSILKERSVGVDLCCHHCGERCQPFLRLDYLQQTRFKRSFRRHSHPD